MAALQELLRILGVLLVAACFGWVADSLVWLLLPSYGDIVNLLASVLGALGEGPIMLWLLIKGAKVQPLTPQPPDQPGEQIEETSAC